ncbi:MAG TPA: hypothetical protein VJ835_05285 [Fimbriimonadaceae bacterium]|nr:hypothetical protein [Fimbriimonadaceae bacterium]
MNRALATAYILPAIVFAPIAKEPLNRLFAYLLGKYQKNTAEILEDLRSWRLEHSHDLVEIFEKAHLSMSGPGKVIGEVARQVAIHVRLAFIRISPPNLPEVKVRIFEVQKGKIIRELAMAPANATRVTPLTVIQDPKSTAMQAVNSKKIQIIPDIKIEVAHGAKSKYFCPSSEDKENAVGSLICYPVQRRTNDEVVAVICIRNAGEHAFDKANSKFYEQELGLYEADLVFSAIFDSANEDN